MCSHSLWSLPPSQLSCEASNNTNTVVRNGGRNLPVSSLKLPHQADTKCFLRFQASAHLDLGVRAGQKLREMARREEEEEVKTKVRQIQKIYINYLLLEQFPFRPSIPNQPCDSLSLRSTVRFSP